jgi:hypothetical protein
MQAPFCTKVSGHLFMCFRKRHVEISLLPLVAEAPRDGGDQRVGGWLRNIHDALVPESKAVEGV